MPIEILMPALSPTMEKGNLAKWLVSEGDAVSAGDVIAEIETDKATMEVEAVDEGTVGKILVPEGTDDVPINQLIALLLEDGEGADALDGISGAPKAVEPTVELEPLASPSAPVTAAPKLSLVPNSPTNGETRVFSSPLARRMAASDGLDLSQISGSGPRGRVVKRDVEAARNAQSEKPNLTPASAAGKANTQLEEGAYEELPHSAMRKIVAERLTESKQTIPHFYLSVDCDLGKLMALRQDINEQAPTDDDGKPNYKVSVNDFVIKAMALALQKVPMANATWTDTARLIYKHSDIGVAVAVPDGLFTPVIRNAEQKTLSAISLEMKDLAGRARAKKLAPHEYQGGVTAISNLGMYGIREFSAVINPPQATILAIGAGQLRPVVRGNKVKAATMMTVTLSCDHRVVDGALGAELIGAFKGYIENPMGMLV